MRRNEVVTVADRSGEATGKPRPAIIVTADEFTSLDWIVICPLTAREPDEGADLMREILRSDRLPLRERSWAEPHKITAIRRRRIGPRIGVLSDVEALWLNRAIVQLLGVAAARWRPPRKRKPAVIEGPAVITAVSERRKAAVEAKAALAASLKLTPTEPERTPVVATSRTPSGAAAKSAIITVRRKGARAILPPGLLPDTPEEHKQRGEAADAMWREVVRRVREGR